MAFYLMFALQCLFPIFDTGPGEYIGVSITNTDAQSREFTVTATPANGTAPASGRVTINAGAQRALMLNEILAAPPSSGWIRIDSAASGCSSYLASGNDQMLAGTEPESLGGTGLLLPHIAVNTGFTELAYSDTQLAIVNTGAGPANITAQLSGLDGGVRGSFPLTLPSGGSRTLRISEAFRDVLPNNGVGGKTFNGYVRLASNVAIAAWQRIDGPVTRSLLRAKRLDDIRSTTLAMIPHFVFGADYNAAINLINPASTPVKLEITAFDNDGARLGQTVLMTLAAGEGRRAQVDAFFSIPVIAIFPPPTTTGYIRIREQSGQPFQIAGDVEIDGATVSRQGLSSMLYAISDASSNRWVLPFAVSSASYFTGYAVVTPNELLAVQTDVQVDIVNSEGTTVDRRMLSLSPLRRQTALIPTGLTGGYVRVTSNLPVHVMGAIGSRDLRLLDQLPAIAQ